MLEWDMGKAFNYSEMMGLIAPRPFMVARGHNDTVGRDHWEAYEYPQVRLLYSQLITPDRTEIEFFDGPHALAHSRSCTNNFIGRRERRAPNVKHKGRARLLAEAKPRPPTSVDFLLRMMLSSMFIVRIASVRP